MPKDKGENEMSGESDGETPASKQFPKQAHNTRFLYNIKTYKTFGGNRYGSV